VATYGSFETAKTVNGVANTANLHRLSLGRTPEDAGIPPARFSWPMTNQNFIGWSRFDEGNERQHGQAWIFRGDEKIATASFGAEARHLAPTAR
jgi:hypothetical protein